MNCTKGAHESQKKKSRVEQRTWKEKALEGLLMIHAFAAHLWSVTGRIHKLQVLKSGHADQRGQNSLTSGVMNAK